MWTQKTRSKTSCAIFLVKSLNLSLISNPVSRGRAVGRSHESERASQPAERSPGSDGDSRGAYDRGKSGGGQSPSECQQRRPRFPRRGLGPGTPGPPGPPGPGHLARHARGFGTRWAKRGNPRRADPAARLPGAPWPDTPPNPPGSSPPPQTSTRLRSLHPAGPGAGPSLAAARPARGSPHARAGDAAGRGLGEPGSRGPRPSQGPPKGRSGPGAPEEGPERAPVTHRPRVRSGAYPPVPASVSQRLPPAPPPQPSGRVRGRPDVATQRAGRGLRGQGGAGGGD
ncbi:proline-rich protein HaeIII subfamily 1-like [Choloepus didactylus]|uniref:proline-rich protein HaeIII subfamily 1-like n=1 Tax=Choloepus didactylus TaxID=27675 RepID=UPI00189C7AE8|nr:proline-rich protein HaeIII subfamily 1-like [Choloepus didactylus]